MGANTALMPGLRPSPEEHISSHPSRRPAGQTSLHVFGSLRKPIDLRYTGQDGSQLSPGQDAVWESAHYA